MHYVADVLAQQYADQHGMPVEDARSLLLRGLFEYNDQFSTTFTDGTDSAQARADAKAFLYQHWATNPDGTQAYSMAVSDDDFVNGNLGIATLLKDPEAYKYVQQALNPGGDPAIAAALEDYYTQQNKKDPQTIAAIDAYVRQQTNKDAMLLLGFAAPGLASAVEIGGKVWQGDYAGAGKQAATDALISAATFGIGKAVGAGIGIVKAAGKSGQSAKAVQEVVATATAAVDKELAPAKRASKETILGHYPEYVTLSESSGSRRFQIPDGVWDSMSDAERWAANAKFLDRTVERGDVIILATPVTMARPGSSYARELDYLKSKGYEVSGDGLKLIRKD